MTIDFHFELDTRYMKYLPEYSSYNHNYYELNLAPYGDCIIARQCNILYIESIDDCCDSYYSLGYFNEQGEFQAMWTWLDEYQMIL